MLKRPSKTDNATHPDRVLLVENNPDAAMLLRKVFREAGFDVADVADHQSAVAALSNRDVPIAVVVASYSNAGAGASLKLLDAIRNHPDAGLAAHRVVLVLDSDGQQAHSFKSGADELLSRPYHLDDLLRSVRETIDRPHDEREAHRRRRRAELAEARSDGAGPDRTQHTQTVGASTGD